MWYTYTHTQWNTIQPLKRLKSAKCNNMNATCGYYAKYSKTDGEIQMPYDSLICGLLYIYIYIWINQKEQTHRYGKNRDSSGGGQRAKWVKGVNSMETVGNYIFGVSTLLCRRKSKYNVVFCVHTKLI